MRPEAIFFDLDDTLVDETGAIREAVRRVVQELDPPGLDPEQVADAYLRASADLWRRVTPAQPGVTVERIRRWTWEEALRALRFHGPVEPFLERYTALRSRLMPPFPDAEEVLDTLHRIGLRLGIITNGEAHVQRWKLERAGLHRFFALMVTSQDVGVAKPDPRIFLEAARRADVHPSACWMVGDQLCGSCLPSFRPESPCVFLPTHAVGRCSRRADTTRPTSLPDESRAGIREQTLKGAAHTGGSDMRRLVRVGWVLLGILVFLNTADLPVVGRSDVGAAARREGRVWCTEPWPRTTSTSSRASSRGTTE